jgi:ABC-2 type transport system permease protein
MPGWLQAISKVNPLSYEVDALRGLLIGTEAHLALDAPCWCSRPRPA